MKFNYTFLILFLALALPGCGPKKAKKNAPENTMEASNTPDYSNVNIELADGKNGASKNADGDVEEFVEVAQQDGSDAQMNSNDFAWVDNDQKEKFKPVYFEFDQYTTVQPEQKAQINYDVEQIKQTLATNQDEHATVVIAGHACHSAGSRTYNLALSEKRAKVVADHFVAAGVAKENIKVVGRGQEVPAIVNDKPVTGSREEQWPNRRVEVAIINS